MDIVIKNAMIVDGSGEAPFKGDVAIAKGKIVAVAPCLDVDAKRVIDAKEKYLTPGFIDTHRHSDAVVFNGNFGEVQVRQGVTTTLNGNCGLSIVPAPPKYRTEILNYLRPITGTLPQNIVLEQMEDYLSAIESQGIPINFGMLQGNGTLRMAVAGFAGTSLNKEQVAQIHHYLNNSIASGIFGVSLGIIYMPENFYTHDEFIEVLKPIAGGSLPIVAHMRGEGDMLLTAIDEVVAIAMELDVPLHISHFKCVGQRNWGTLLEQALNKIAHYRSQGLTITYDVYPWQAGSSQLVQVLPPAYLEGGIAATIQRLSDPTQKAECIALLQQPQTEFENLVDIIGWENIMISSVKTEKNQEFVGLRATEIAALTGTDVYRAMLDFMVEERGEIGMVNFIANEDDIIRIMKDPYSHIVSDSIYPDSGLPHPRQYGTHAKVLQEYVHEKKVLSIQQAIHKMTGRPAALFAIDGKGLVQEGYDADLVLFDIRAIKNNATYTNPKQFATGFSYVLVNGEIVNEHDSFQKKSAGKVLRRKYS